MRALLLALALLFGGSAGAQAPGEPSAGPLWGINISGGEFRGVEGGALIPKPAELRAYHAAGFRLFRIPFKASQLDRPDARARLRALADACVMLAAPCIFDRHEYKWPVVAEQANTAVKFDGAMPKSDLIHYEPMNEPKGVGHERWARDVNAITALVRKAGVTRRLWWGWPGYQATFRFAGTKGVVEDRKGRGCGTAACAIRRAGGLIDPLNKSGLAGHRYSDKDGSGTNDFCKNYTHVRVFARAAEEFGVPVMLGEIAFGSGRGIRQDAKGSCRTFGAKVIAEIKASPNMYGVTWWGGGRAWNPNYVFHTPADPALPYVRMIQGR